MRKIVFSALLAAACLNAGVAGAQTGNQRKPTITKEETVILQGGQDGRTVIEIKDGNVYVNGEKVVSVQDGDAATVHKKIIVENGGTGTMQGFPGNPADMESLQQLFGRGFGFGDGDEGSMEPQKPVLGVNAGTSPDGKGAIVKSIVPGSAAEKAGLKEGDRITKIDGMAIADPQSLVAAISGHKPGEQVSITYNRGGKDKTAQAALGAAPQVSMRSFSYGPDGWQRNDGGSDMPNMMLRPFGFDGMEPGELQERPKLGVTVEDLTDGSGVRVMDVKPGSVAGAAGLQQGDVITAIDGTKTGSVDALQGAVRGLELGKKGRLSYDRGGRSGSVDVTLPKAVKRREL